MPIELTEQQRSLVRERGGQPVELVDPQTHQTYILIAREQFEQVHSGSTRAHPQPSPLATQIPDGIRRSQQALRRELPKLLEQPNLPGQWVAYHGEERIGIAPREAILLQECARRGLRDDEVYIGWIDPSELAEEEDVDMRPQHFADETTTPKSHTHGQGS